MKPVSQYTIIGKSYRNTVTTSKVTARETWATDVRLPGMLHARMVHPKTLGSTLVSAGELDKTRFPNAQVVVKGNLVGVVAPTEWEAIRAAQQVASDYEVDGLERAARQRKPVQIPERKRRLESDARHQERQDHGRRGARAGGGREEALRHVRVSVPEARAHRTDHGRGGCSSGRDRCTSTRTTKIPRRCAAKSRRCSARRIDHVVVHTFAGAGHYGRSNGGNAGGGRRSGHPVEGRRPARCACSGCAPTTSSGPRSRRLRSPTSKSDWTRTARWSPIKSITTCPRCRTTGLSAR